MVTGYAKTGDLADDDCSLRNVGRWRATTFRIYHHKNTKIDYVGGRPSPSLGAASQIVDG